MSPRNDTLLSQCLAQAELSPLHYRHGSIIVRGGKVIGQGFNSYRPGFDGGALKTGILPSATLDGPAIAELKQRLKSKPKHKSKSTLDNQQDSATFTPFESMGQGRNANTPLSLHSEMMAIQSALSLSSGTLSSQTSARSAKYYQKPCFSLSGDSKKRKLRARGLKAYAEAVCAEATETGTVKSHSGKFSLQKQGFEPRTSQPGVQGEQRQVQQQGGGQRVSGGQGGRGFEHMERYRETPNEEERVQKHYAHKRGSEPQSSRDLGENTTSIVPQPSSQSETSSSDDNYSPRKVKIKPSRKPPPLPPKTEQILVTKKSTLNSKPSVAARTKDLRLKGSDLYVARLGNCNTSPAKPSITPPESHPTYTCTPIPQLPTQIPIPTRRAIPSLPLSLPFFTTNRTTAPQARDQSLASMLP
ncbi:hypothetical protein LAWI1_G006327, partial [Lachnellula willkommii]